MEISIDDRVNEIIREYPSADSEYIENVLISEGYDLHGLHGWVIL